jgi:hypothetical protein
MRRLLKNGDSGEFRYLGSCPALSARAPKPTIRPPSSAIGKVTRPANGSWRPSRPRSPAAWITSTGTLRLAQKRCSSPPGGW